MSRRAASVAAEALVLDEALSFWGGLDPETGTIVDPHHPQVGACVTGTVLVLPGTRGSTNSAGTLLESLRTGAGPVAVVGRRPDAAIAVACSVAGRLYGRDVPYVLVGADVYAGLTSGERLTIDVATATLVDRTP